MNILFVSYSTLLSFTVGDIRSAFCIHLHSWKLFLVLVVSSPSPREGATRETQGMRGHHNSVKHSVS